MGVAGTDCYPEPAVLVNLTVQHPQQGPIPLLP